MEHHPLKGAEFTSELLHLYPDELTPQADERVGDTYLLMRFLTCLYLEDSPTLPLEHVANPLGQLGLWLHGPALYQKNGDRQEGAHLTIPSSRALSAKPTNG